MKTLITLFVLGLLSQSAFALNLQCIMYDNNGVDLSNDKPAYEVDGMDVQAFVVQNVEARCKSFGSKNNSGDYYTVQIRGIGPGLRWNFLETFTVSCPLVRKSKVDEKGKLIVGGPHVSVSPIVGAQAGAFVGQRGAVCILGGVQLGIGAGASISRLKITQGWSFPDDSFFY
jgi:hypothetical protein